MFWTRVISAIILGISVVFIVLQGELWIFFALVNLIVILGIREFSRLARSTRSLPSWILSAIIACLFCLSSFRPNWLDINLVFCLAVGLPFLIEIVRRNPPSALLNISATLLGVLYVGWLFGRHIILLRQMSDGRNLIFFLMGVTWGGDIGAYLIGMRLGKHKIIPAISPGKSIEGYFAGIIFSFAVALAFRHWLLSNIGLLHIIILGIGLAVIGQIGDLAESLLKRGANMKDSGRIMPGHGGILDRCDSMIFIAPALYYYAIYILHLS